METKVGRTYERSKAKGILESFGIKWIYIMPSIAHIHTNFNNGYTFDLVGLSFENKNK
jgi:hypothetical protein